jgi:hypothetical protein
MHFHFFPFVLMVTHAFFSQLFLQKRNQKDERGRFNVLDRESIDIKSSSGRNALSTSGPVVE